MGGESCAQGLPRLAPERRESLCGSRQPCIWLQGVYGQELVAHSLCKHLFSPLLLAALALERVLPSTFLTTLSHRTLLANDSLGVSSAMDRLKDFHSKPVARPG